MGRPLGSKPASAPFHLMKPTARLRPALAAAALACAFFTSSASAQVVNGGFESGSFSPGWTLVDPSPFAPPSLSNVGSNPVFAFAGTHYANLTSDPGFTATLSQ